MTTAHHRQTNTNDTWPTFSHEGVTYDVSHLRSYVATFQRPEVPGKPVESYSVKVTFSHHCFTRGLPTDGKPHDAALRYDFEGDQRLFDQKRWELSKKLPTIIASMGERKCLLTDAGNFFTIIMMAEDGTELEYEIFFRTWKPGRGRIHLHVESAYVREPEFGSSRPKAYPVSFFVILHNTLNGKPIKGNR